mgnify:CR=1 FL=1
MIDRSVRIGVIGAGYWGSNLIRNCAELGVLDSVYDVDESAVEAARRAYPSIAAVTELEELFSRPVNAVIIAAPAKLHADIALKAIAHGKHVFVEKPLALSVADGKQIEREARAAGLTLFVGHLLFYHPAVKKLRSMIAEGVIGDIWHIRSRRLSLGRLRTEENVWWSFAPHDVALITAIFRDEPLRVTSAQSYGRGMPISDVAYADFEFSNGRSAHIEVSWLDPDKTARLDIFGTRGVLTFIDSTNGSSLALKPFMISTNDSGTPVAIRGEELNIEFEKVEPLKAEIEAFVDSIVYGRQPETDARQGIAVLRVLSMADEAAHTKVVQEVST